MNTKKPQRNPGTECPLYKKDVSKVCHNCEWYMALRGTNKNTGQEVDDWGCAVVWNLIALIENAQMTREMGGALESLRNVTAISNVNRDLKIVVEDVLNNEEGQVSLEDGSKLIEGDVSNVQE